MVVGAIALPCGIHRYDADFLPFLYYHAAYRSGVVLVVFSVCSGALDYRLGVRLLRTRACAFLRFHRRFSPQFYVRYVKRCTVSFTGHSPSALFTRYAMNHMGFALLVFTGGRFLPTQRDLHHRANSAISRDHV